MFWIPLICFRARFISQGTKRFHSTLAFMYPFGYNPFMGVPSTPRTKYFDQTIDNPEYLKQETIVMNTMDRVIRREEFWYCIDSLIGNVNLDGGIK